jgi:hypothetical protein
MGQLDDNGGSTKFLVRGAVSNDRVRKLVSVKGGRGGEGGSGGGFMADMGE